MTKKTLYGVCIALALSALIYFSDSPENILGTYNSLETEVDVSPFAVARGATTTVYDDSGKVAYKFNAVRLEHYTDEDIKKSAQAKEHAGDGVFTLVERPQLIIYQNNEPWVVLADKGKMTSSDQQIELWQNVMVKHLSSAGIPTEINTERLFIDPIGKFANTEESVRITSEKIELEGVGMTADLNNEKINLLSQVHGIHDPN